MTLRLTEEEIAELLADNPDGRLGRCEILGFRDDPGSALIGDEVESSTYTESERNNWEYVLGAGDILAVSIMGGFVLIFCCATVFGALAYLVKWWGLKRRAPRPDALNSNAAADDDQFEYYVAVEDVPTESLKDR